MLLSTGDTHFVDFYQRVLYLYIRYCYSYNKFHRLIFYAFCSRAMEKTSEIAIEFRKTSFFYAFTLF